MTRTLHEREIDDRRSLEMPRIERVLHLQEVPLFRYCAAEEIVRLARIAVATRFAAAEPIFRRDDASRSLYCLVEGEVELSQPGGATSETRGPHQSFGVVDILSGRRRQMDARAATDLVVLRIDADDFFDLLAHNVEIVKALFREVLGERR